MTSYKIGTHTPDSIDWKPGDRLQIDAAGNTAECVGFQISCGNESGFGFQARRVWFEDGVWMMPHPTNDHAAPICAPEGASITPRISYETLG